jgi:hypothetical protein
LESFSIVDGIYKHHSSGTLVISLSDCLESLLASSVPNLHFDLDIVDINGFNFEIYANRGDVGNFVLLIGVAQKNVGFTDSGVADDDYFDEVVVLLLLATFGHVRIFKLWD